MSFACLLTVSFHNFLDSLHALQLLLCCLLSICKDYISHSTLVSASRCDLVSVQTGPHETILCSSEDWLCAICDTKVLTHMA